MKWKEEFRTNSHGTDANGVMRASYVMKYMQEAAGLQMRGMTPSYEELHGKGMAFILSRIRMSIYQPIRAREDIAVLSWACDSKGASFNRCCQILRDGIIIAEAVSVWALTSVGDKKLYRVSDIDFDYEPEEMLELDFPGRFRIPSDVRLSLMGEKAVEYSDIDINRHMNSTNYPDLLCNYIPVSEMTQSRVIGLAINYNAEAKIGDILKVYCGESDGMYYFRTQKNDGTVNIEAEITLERI